MTDFQIADNVDEKHPSETDDTDTNAIGDSIHSKEKVPNQSDATNSPLPDGVDNSNENPTDKIPSEYHQLVKLAWLPEEDATEMPIPDCVEANGRRIAKIAREDELEDVRSSLEEAHFAVDELREENDRLRERINALEDREARLVRNLRGLDNDIRPLLTASDLNINGTCPKCNDAPLIKNQPIGGMNRIECANNDCKYLAAEME